MNKQVISWSLALSLSVAGMPVTVLSAPLAKGPTTYQTGVTAGNHIDLTLGKAQIIRLKSAATRVSISNPDAVGLILISPNEVQLTGKAVGSANLLVWTEASGNKYDVIDLSVSRDVSNLARRIKAIDPGIQIIPMAADNAVVLTGVAESLDKAQLAYDLAKAFLSNGEASQAGGQTPEISSNTAGSSSFAGSTTQIINLIRVVGQPATKAEMVQQRLQDIDPNISLRVVPGFGGKEKAILMGRVQTASMVSKAINLTSVFYGTPGIKVIAGPGGNSIGESGGSGGGSSGGSSGSSDSGSGGSSGGGGLVGNLSNNVLAGSIITDTSGNVVSLLEVNERPQVRCTVKILEIQKNSGINLGASHRLNSNKLNVTTFAGANNSGTSASSFFNQVNGGSAAQIGILWGNELASFLSGLVTTGKARVLAEPTITSISGEPATFLAGGEFPVPIANINGVTIQYREFGVRLNILPTVTDHGTIHMQVTPEVSTLDATAGVTVGGNVIPGLRTRRSQTVVEMRNGENFVMSGLYNDNMSDLYNKTPILGQIPIIGNLFRSRAYQRNETEMVIIIHPEIEHSMDLTFTKPAPPAPVESTTPGDPLHQSQADPFAPLQPGAPAPQETALQAPSAVVAPTSALANGSRVIPAEKHDPFAPMAVSEADVIRERERLRVMEAALAAQKVRQAPTQSTALLGQPLSQPVLRQLAQDVDDSEPPDEPEPPETEDERHPLLRPEPISYHLPDPYTIIVPSTAPTQELTPAISGQPRFAPQAPQPALLWDPFQTAGTARFFTPQLSSADSRWLAPLWVLYPPSIGFTWLNWLTPETA